MNIALVSSTYLPQINGVSLSIESLAKAIRNLGHRVHIITSTYPHFHKDSRNVTRIASYTLVFHRESRLPNPWLHSSRRQIRWILDQDWDIIHVQVPWFLEFDAMRWAGKLNVPLVHTFHTLFEEYGHYSRVIPPSLWSAASRRWCFAFCNKMDLILAPSTPVKEYLESGGVRPRIEVSPTGINIEEFSNPHGDRFRQTHGIMKASLILLFVGRIGREKNLPFLFEVLKRVRSRHPDILLLIAGDGPERPYLTRLAQRQGLDSMIRFLGYLEHQELVSCYDAADLFVFASITETQGIVLTEAMAAGTPVVAVGKMGVRDVLAPGLGGIEVELDVDRFAGAVLRLLGDRHLYDKKRQEAFQLSRRFSVEAMAERTIEYYRSIIDQRRGAPF